MSRAFLIVLDSVGCGGAPDADRFFNGRVPDTGANTLAHIAQACAAGRGDQAGLRSGPLTMPNLAALGLGAAITLASGDDAPGLDCADITGRFAAATEASMGKDTPSGHWELAGVPVPWAWHHFPDQDPAFSLELMDLIAKYAGTDGTLCNQHGSGTAVIDDFAPAHLQTGWPIIYTSADSVLQIAAHEVHFGLPRLLKLCEDLAPHLHAMKVGRVIARPFVGDTKTGFTRTPNRHDYAIALPEPSLCDWVKDSGGMVIGIGKIGDIFSMQGIDAVTKGPDAKLMTDLIDLVDSAPDGALVFANFVEFDSQFGHRRDVPGYAHALEWFDGHLPALFAAARPGDLFIFTADHGNDPTFTGTDHTRERVPVLMRGFGPDAPAPGPVGICNFVDVAATVAAHLNLKTRGPGKALI